MNSSNNSFGLVRGSSESNRYSLNNKKYVLSQLITKRIGINDIISRKDINEKFKSGITKLDGKYINNIIKGLDKQFKICEKCLSHKRCQNYNKNNYKTYSYDNKEFTICYVNIEDEEYYFHVDVILDNNILKYVPYVIIKVDEKIENSEITISNQDIIIDKSNIVVINNPKKIIIEKFKRIDNIEEKNEMEETTIIEINLIKDELPELTEKEIISKFKKDFINLEEINGELEYWFDILEKYPHFGELVNKYLYYLIEQKEIYKVVGSINRHYYICDKRSKKYSKRYSQFDKNTEKRIYDMIASTPSYLYK